MRVTLYGQVSGQCKAHVGRGESLHKHDTTCTNCLKSIKRLTFIDRTPMRVTLYMSVSGSVLQCTYY